LKRALAALLLLAAFAACGKKGDPLPPLSRVPQPVTDLKIAQRGRELIYSFTAPRVTVGAVRLPVLEIELQRASGEGDFQKLAKRDRRKAAPGETLQETVPLPAPGTIVRVTARAIAGGTPSQVTKIVALTVAAPPPTPTDFKADLQPNGVAFSWKGVLPPLPPSPPPPSPTPAPR
jgi:predicted small lipoprotein YifL